jgi:hypothetical protein
MAFVPTYSTNEIWRDNDRTRCLTDDLDAIESDISSLETGKASSNHTHPTSQITGLADALASKASSTHTHSAADVGAAAATHNHDASYAALSHTHAQSNITGLGTALSGKADVEHTHDQGDITGLTGALSGKAAATHTHAQSDVTGLAAALEGKAAANHTHTGYASSTHTHTPASIGAAAETHGHTIANVSGLSDALAGKAAANHTHSYNDLTNKPTIPAAYTHPATHPASMITGLSSVATSGKYSDLTGKPTIPTIPASLPANGGNADTVDGKHASAFALADHIHGTTPVTETNTNLDNYSVAGVYSFAAAYQPVNRPSGTSNGWLVVVPWTSNPTTQTVKQFWLRHGSISSNDHEVYTRTKIGDYGWSSWAKVITSKDMTITKENGDVYVSWTGQDVVAKLTALAPGMYTAYSRGGASAGTTNAPNSSEGFRYLIHKTGEGTTNYGWAIAFGTSGSVYAGYHDAGTWRGWRALYKGLPDLLWSGVYYMSANQTVTPTKKLSECKTGWMLLWSDYDVSTGKANDGDFVTTIIPKWNPSGTTWAGKSFYCDVPRYIGANQSDVATESRIIKMIYVHDNKIVGHAANNQGVRSDVVLRAVYEI